MNLWQIFAYLTFFIYQLGYPFVFVTFKGNNGAIFFSYPFAGVLTVFLILMAQKRSIKTALKQQHQCLTAYVLATLSVFFTHQIYKMTNQDIPTCLASYTNFYIVCLIYSFFLSSQLNLIKYILMQFCSTGRLIFYAFRSADLINRTRKIDTKDYDLLIMATQIAIYVFFIEELRKNWQKQRSVKKSLLQSLQQ